jgi:RNA polymerase sigma-70 factor (ECF subfamily)
MSEGTVTDRELIRKYLEGDGEAFEVLYRRYRLPLYGYLNGFVPGRSAVADDLFQQTWVQALGALERYRHQERFSAWLFRIAHNLAMDYFRQPAGEREPLPPEDMEAVAGADGHGSPWEQLSEAEFRAALGAAVAGLAPAQREVLLLRQQGVAFKEIARIQNSGINTVLGRMHYAVQHLRRRLDAWTRPADG